MWNKQNIRGGCERFCISHCQTTETAAPWSFSWWLTGYSWRHAKRAWGISQRSYKASQMSCVSSECCRWHKMSWHPDAEREPRCLHYQLCLCLSSLTSLKQWGRSVQRQEKSLSCHDIHCSQKTELFGSQCSLLCNFFWGHCGTTAAAFFGADGVPTVWLCGEETP